MVTTHGNTELPSFAGMLTDQVQKEIMPKEGNMLTVSKNVHPGKEEAQPSVRQTTSSVFRVKLQSG